MKPAKFGRIGMALLVLSSVSGCTYIKSLFPDKERDYQFRSEIPDLVIPDDLKPQAVASNRMPIITATANTGTSPAKPVEKSTEKPIVAKAKPVELSQKATEPLPVKVEVANAAVSSLQIDQEKIQAWRLVAKSLSRQRIEIVERNLDNAYFNVKYDPNAVKPQDQSFWDEMTFLFGDDPSHEQQYRISLTEIAPQTTEVTVQNTAGQTISTPTATRLLKLITDGINADPSSASETRDKAVP